MLTENREERNTLFETILTSYENQKKTPQGKEITDEYITPLNTDTGVKKMVPTWIWWSVVMIRYQGQAECSTGIQSWFTVNKIVKLLCSSQ